MSLLSITTSKYVTQAEITKAQTHAGLRRAYILFNNTESLSSVLSTRYYQYITFIGGYTLNYSEFTDIVENMAVLKDRDC